ncbi:MFS transporter [Kocuria tytonis]|uniref:MFS transporter n=1 Tax=Kocuria tytonis TaxID=2054280 RepID=A0A495ABE8_9MICC|nr:MFS transporter [Kocuria tytonis]RKQ36830.1 hypothetical protein C1C97_004260 [Kocuria tytonis]
MSAGTTRDGIRLTVLLAGLLLSTCGDDIAAIAFSLRAARSGSPQLLAAILLAQSVPALALGLFGGVIADRSLRWWWWPASLLVQGLLFITMAVLQRDAVIVLCVALTSAVAALTGPVANKLIARHSRNHQRTGGHLATVNGLSQAAGAALGGVAFGMNGVAPLLLVDAASFLLLAVVALAVTGRAPVPLDSSARGGVLLGFSRLAAPGSFGVAGLLLLAWTVFATSLEGVAGVFVLTGPAAWTSAHVGLAWGLWGVGLVAGGQFAGRVRGRATPLLVAGAACMGAVFLVLACFLPGFGAAAPLFGIGGAANGAFNAAVSRIILTAVPLTEQARCWAAYRWIVTCCLVAGYVVGGAAGAQHGVAALAGAGGLAVLGAVVRVVAGAGGRRAPRKELP